MTSKAIGFTGATVPCFLSSFSSCSLDFFFAFLPPASPPPVGMCLPSMDRVPQRIDATAIAELEEHAAAVRATVDIAARFVIPGEDELSARLDLARAVCRRAERRLVALADGGQIDGEHLLPWVNRLSDVLFVLSRAVEPGARPARED